MSASTAADVRQHILDIAKPIMVSKGFTAVGLNEILLAAGVPKGSFYHYFASKEVFGESMLEAYFADYLAYLDDLLVRQPGTGAQRLMRYWTNWQHAEEGNDPEGKCLAVKLGAEVCDLSQSMRIALEHGATQIIGRLAACIGQGIEDGSITGAADPAETAAALYQLWMGSTLVGKFRRDGKPFEVAMAMTRRVLGMPPED